MTLRTIVMTASLSATLLLSLFVVAGFLGALHPAFDSFAHFRVHFSVMMALAALPLLFSSWRAHGFMALLLAVGATLTAVGLPSLGIGPAHAAFETRPVLARSYSLLHLNLRYNHAHPERVLDLLEQNTPDFVFLNEVSEMWNAKLRGMQNLYPFQLRCGGDTRVGGTAILSRHAFSAGRLTECAGSGSIAMAQVELDGTALDLVSMHLGWPWPFDQPRQIGLLTEKLASLGPQAIVAGDLNAVPWSNAVRRVIAAGALSAMRSPGPTWLFGWLPTGWRQWIGLPIDHIFKKGDIAFFAGGALPDVGSDHLPLFAEFGLPESDGHPQDQIVTVWAR